jgi:hypothetical protein
VPDQFDTYIDTNFASYISAYCAYQLQTKSSHFLISTCTIRATCSYFAKHSDPILSGFVPKDDIGRMSSVQN